MDYIDINYENNMKLLNEAIACCEAQYSHEELINELSCDNDIKKQLCIIEIKKLNSAQEAYLLVQNLTGKSGPVREVCSFKILDLIQNKDYREFFQSKEIENILIKGIVDINPSVSRNIVEAIKYINDKKYLINNIITEINKTIEELKNTTKNRSYTLNKKNFNLYWNLEALISINEAVEPNEKLIKIITTTAHSNDYTIREKTAKLIFLLKNNNIFSNLAESLRNDENMYVNNYFK